MSENKTPTKEQILKTIEQLEKNPNDKLGILADIGIGVVGAGATGAAVAAFGGGTFLLFGLVALPVAAPLGLVVGGAALGAAALVGAKRIMFDGTFNQGKQAEILKQLQELLREVEAKERASKVRDRDSDKTKFIVSLKEPVRLNLITPQRAQDLMRAVESGQIPITEAIKMVQAIVEAAKPQ
ncbi:hypothetical protein QUB60_10155 [Microcoleus sp. A2-C5]|uniref:hypothetical protein n=1 Tax=unclassified Microcoleus TaxID=2642155 RepID=UPI002FD16C43